MKSLDRAPANVGHLTLEEYGLHVADVVRNAEPARLYEDAVLHDGGRIGSSGALISLSGNKTGRSPKDKRVVEEPDSRDDIWWGPVNIPLSPARFAGLRHRAIDSLNTCPRLYVVDGFAGWAGRHRLKVRTIAARPYHALFMHNMLIRPTAAELAGFGEPDFVILNAGQFPATSRTADVSLTEGNSSTAVALSFGQRELVILGTQYAGEMKKGVFTIMNYLLPRRGMLSMHCSANEGTGGDVSLFFGLSGTGKTTLSADPRRRLIGDDEHCWSDEGIFNIEGGCYAKCIRLSPEGEPQIFQAIRFGAVLENVVLNEQTRQVDYHSDAITENTRASYPLEFIPGAKLPAVAGHPRNIIFLTCDAFGVLPPVSKLSAEQARYHFLSGYTAKVAGTEVGVHEPEATFSACFGAAFLVWHPMKYAEMLAERMERYGSAAWLVNTGWSGGPYGVGSRIKLAHTRAIIDAIHGGTLAAAPSGADPVFGLQVPTACPGVPRQILQPRGTWQDRTAYDAMAKRLAKLFQENFAHYAQGARSSVHSGGPLAGVR
jgi:phosphoenolpyruvate carboxykinase (ATP)